MRILFLGDVVGQPGCDAMRRFLPRLKERFSPDVTIINGENSAEGNGCLPQSARHLFDSGADVLTLGNHALQRREIYPVLERRDGVIRPANLHPSAPGGGVYVVDLLRAKLAVINLLGAVFLDPYQSPFDAVEALLPTLDTKNILVDFHAEASSEKIAMGLFLDGRVSAVIGTHFHVQTADERILPGGTAYITDAGMCGGLNSVLGMRYPCALERMRTKLPLRCETDTQEIRSSGVFVELDEGSGRALCIERFCIG